MAHRRAREDVDDALAVQDKEVPVQCLSDPAWPVERESYLPSSPCGFPFRSHEQRSPHAWGRYKGTKYGTVLRGNYGPGVVRPSRRSAERAAL
jgi:hypothetical protein